ncbi:MAG: DUF1049 domain-containing protein [bacterium]|nr:MAG: DUF1049 domain-containing protein [bacterium]
MSRTVTLILLVVVVAFSYFAFYNQAYVSVNLWKGKSVELPLIGVALVSMAAGALMVLVFFAVRGVRRTYGQVQEGFKRRRRTKAEELYNRGVDAHLSGKEEQAVKLLEDAVEKDPDFLLPFFRLGNVYLKQGKYDQAIALHQKARTAHPRNLRVLLGLVDDYLGAGKPEEAAAILREVIGRDDGNRTALAMLRNIQEDLKDWEGAVETQRKLLKVSGKPADGQDYLRGLKYEHASSLLDRGETERAIKLLKEILKEDPGDIAAIVRQGEAYIAVGKLDEGLAILEAGYRDHKNPVFLQVMEDKLLEKENPKKLIEAYRVLLDSMPQDIFLNLFYGKTCLRLEMIDEGFMALKKVESLGYDSPLLHALLGEFNARRERLEEALDEYRKYMEFSLGMNPQYQCGNCGEKSKQWSARCQNCGKWSTSTLPAIIESPPQIASAPQYDTEE